MAHNQEILNIDIDNKKSTVKFIRSGAHKFFRVTCFTDGEVVSACLIDDHAKAERAAWGHIQN